MRIQRFFGVKAKTRLFSSLNFLPCVEMSKNHVKSIGLQHCFLPQVNLCTEEQEWKRAPPSSAPYAPPESKQNVYNSSNER